MARGSGGQGIRWPGDQVARGSGGLEIRISGFAGETIGWRDIRRWEARARRTGARRTGARGQELRVPLYN